MPLAILLYRTRRQPKILPGITPQEAVKVARRTPGTRLAWLDPTRSREAAELFDIIRWMFQVGMQANEIIRELDRAHQLTEALNAGRAIRHKTRKKA